MRLAPAARDNRSGGTASGARTLSYYSKDALGKTDATRVVPFSIP